jgi:hypothetical protein
LAIDDVANNPFSCSFQIQKITLINLYYAAKNIQSTTTMGRTNQVLASTNQRDKTKQQHNNNDNNNNNNDDNNSQQTNPQSTKPKTKPDH